jgi:hypothetical protein|tara:strand:- start:287 stop:712 length:426 start_codon:yes stop_codon:yes gene_type:complete
MALIGGGGAGNVAGGANPSGVGSSINYIGNHAYAYSGTVTSAGSQSNPTTTALQFDTAGSYIQAIVAWANTQTSGTADNHFGVFIDSQAIFQAQFREGGDSNHTNPKNLHILIPPFSKFEVKVGTSADPHDWTITLVGDVY